MRKQQRIGLTCILATVLTIPLVGQPLTGSYSVGPGGSYANLAAAIGALTSNGVSGPTTFTVTGNETGGPWTLGAVTGQGMANPIVFDGLGLATLSGGSPMLTLSGCSHVTFSGFNATFGATSVGVQIAAGTSSCVFTSCNFTAPTTTSSGGKVFDLAGGTGCRIEESTFGGSYEAFYAAVANDGTIIQRCRITGGGWWIARIAAMNFTLVNNFITGNSNYGVSAGVSGSTTDPNVGANLLIQNNSFYIVHPSGGSQYCSLRWYSGAAYTEVRNNVFTDIYPAGTGTSFNMWCLGSQRPVVMDFNVFWAQNGAAIVYAGTNLTLAGWQALGYDLSSVNSDPLFAAPTATPPDLTLTPVSPCIGAGVTIPTVPIDFFGTPRTPPFDIGAHEFTGGPPPLGEYQINTALATLTVNGVSGTGASPAVVNLAINAPGILDLSSSNLGFLWELGLGLAPLIPVSGGAFVTADNQALNLDLSDPTFTTLWNLFQSPGFIPLSIPFSVPSAASLSTQMLIVAPTMPTGIGISQPTRLIVQ